MNKSIKTALLFSTLLFGAVEAPAVVNHTVNTAIVAHADATTNNDYLASQNVNDPVIRNILKYSVNAQENKNYSNANQITKDDLTNLTSISYSGSLDSNQNPTEKLTDSSLSGITKDLLPNVTSVSINNVDFTSVTTLHPLIQWDKISSLSLTHDNINSNLLNTIKGWSDSALSTIDVSNNKISSLDFLKDITINGVTTINISNNQVSDFSPVVNTNWVNLNTLDASHNNITDISPIINIKWPNLTTLNVSYNSISNIKDFNNTDWTSLNSLDASYNQIKDISSIQGQQSKFSQLTNFNVQGNKISDLSPVDGFKFGSGSHAEDQKVENSLTKTIPSDNQPVQIDSGLVDVSLDNSLIASLTPSDVSYITYDNLTTTGGDVSLIGKDGKPSQQNGNNGIKTIQVKYDNQPTTTVKFHFTSGLNNRDASGRFSGTYTLTINWQEPNNNSNNSGSNTNNSGSNNSGSNSTSNTGSNNTGVVDDHTNNSGTPNSGTNNGLINDHGNNSGKAEKTVYSKVIGTRGLNLYKKNAFTKKNKIKSYKKATGNKRPLFKVVKKVVSSIKTPRYFVYQIDPFTNKEIKNTRGYITASSKYVTPLYYTSGVKEVKVTSKTVTSYKKANLKVASKKYKRGTVLKVKSVKKHGNAYSLQLQNGKFVTANKYFVVKVK
ncbi:leucine-rich repeat domain-containing protein [Apilactobacillus apinorum]|uniref:DUF5776 domain-containing protein n=1 Tax=Apilactobacillus apinorum TaxID=1218495 RepID=A0ABP9ZHC6_9LACO